MTGKFAQDTTVSADRSMEEIRKTIKRYGAEKFGTIEDGDHVAIAFEMRKRRVRFVMNLPQKKHFVYEANNRYGRRGEFSPTAYDQAVRQKWRALLLCIKAKLESVESGIEDFDDAFMAQLVLPDNRTAGEWFKPQIENAYLTGEMPPMLPAGS